MRHIRHLALTLSMAALGCADVLGIPDGRIADTGDECLLNTDCEGDEVCLFKICSPECDGNKDCPDGSCLKTEGRAACVKDGVGQCDSDDDCPAGSKCSDEDGQCRGSCGATDPCPQGQSCSASSLCVDDDASGGSAGMSGTGGVGTSTSTSTSGSTSSSTGGTGGVVGGTGGTGGSTGGSGGGGMGGTAMSGDGGTGGSSQTPECDEEGALFCVGTASAERVVCQDGMLEPAEPCGDGELCDNASSESGQCEEVPPECEGRSPGEAFCEGAVRMVCGEDLVTVDQSECTSAQHCAASTGPDCVACLGEEFLCDDEVLYACDDNEFVQKNPYPCPDENCNEAAGACTDNACLTAGALRCAGDFLQRCSDDLQSWDDVTDCGEGLCDPVALACDKCVPNSASCASNTSRSICDSEGQDETVVPCATGTCSGPDGSAVCSCPTAPTGCAGEGTVCRSGQLGTCSLDAYGCVEVSDAACQSPKTCTGSFPDAACTCPSAPSGCAGEGTVCRSGQLGTCSLDGAGCLEVSDTACQSPKTCTGSFPDAACTCPTAPTGCAGEGTVCRSGQLGTCSLDGAGCLEVSDTACQSPKTCTGSFPNAACTCPSVTACDSSDEEDGSYCSGQTLVTCSADSAGCQREESAACGVVSGTEQCVGSHPNAQCEVVVGDAATSANTASFTAEFIFLNPVTLGQSLRLRRLGFLGNSTGDVLMALYDDTGSGPGDLITASDPFTPVDGRNEVVPNLTPTLSAGTYWVGVLGEQTVFVQRNAGTGPAHYADLSAGVFPNTLPTPWSGTSLNTFTLKFYLIGLP